MLLIILYQFTYIITLQHFQYLVWFKFHMILEQNYLKIIQYSQKAFKIFCRRSLANAIVKSLQKRNEKEKQKIIDENEQTNNLNMANTKITSQKSLIYLPTTGQEVFDGDSIISDARKTQNFMERLQQENKNSTVINRLQIMYGDLVYIQFQQKNSTSPMRAKHFLNKLKFLPIDQIGVGASSDLRCVFEIVYPGINLQAVKRGTLVNKSGLICLRSISKKQYIRIKSSKTAYSQQFGKQLQLTKLLNEWCVFEIKYPQDSNSGDTIISGQKVIIKMFGEQLYMNVLQNEQQVFFSQTPIQFTLIKLKKKIQNFVPHYFKMSSNKFQIDIFSNPTDLDSLSQKKQITNINAVNQLNLATKINPITFTQFDFSKALQQDPKFATTEFFTSNSVLNCWQLIECTGKNDNVLYQIYNPVTNQGIIVKLLKNSVKLTPNVKQFSTLKMIKKDEDIMFFSTQNSLHQLDIIFDRTSQKYVFVISKPQVQNNSKFIKIKPISTKSAYLVCEMTEILDVLKQIYDFLNAWGNQVDQKTQIVLYSVKQIKLGSSAMLKKVRQLRMIIKMLKNYLQNPQYSVQQIQNLINSMKILQMIINLCKVITIKIGYNYPQLQEDISSPFCFAKNNLEKILKFLFVIILRMATDNMHNSTLVISQVNFFNKILIAYPQQIGQILQQSIKNLSIFTTKSSTNGSNQLFLWVKLIQPLREDNIRIQKTYIDIIAEVVIDPLDRGISQYQNKCKQLLFIQTSKRKGIPKFGIDQQSRKPIIIFQNETMMSEFLQKNQQLSKLNLVHLNSASYFIEGFFNERLPSIGSISQQYIGYISSVIKMFRNLCRNRNKKLFKIVDDWGITEEHIQAVFNSKNISWVLKTSYLNLWTTIYIDEDPFLPFQKRQSKCHFWDKIQKYNIQDCTALIFKQYTDQNLAISKLNQFGPKIYPILSHFFQQFILLGSGMFIQDQMQKCFPIVLKTVYEMMNLGYMTLKTMKEYIHIILYILNTMIEKNSGTRRPTQNQTVKFNQTIILKTIRILALYENIWVEIYGISFLLTFYRNSLQRNYTITREAIQQKWEDILKNKFDQPSTQQSGKHTLRKRTRFTGISQVQSMAQKSKNYQVRHGNCSFEQLQNQIVQFLISLLSKRVLQHKCQCYQQLINLINRKMERRERVCFYLKQIMILSYEKEEQIYRNFSGRQSNKLLNWLKIQQIVTKITQIETNNNNDEIQLRTKKQKILQLNNILVKVNREMGNYKIENASLLKKCQFILQKLNVHMILLDLLKYNERQTYKQLMKTILKFFAQFIFANEPNCKSLVPHVNKFMKNLNYEELIDIIPILVCKSNDKDSAYKTAHELIFKLSKTQITLPLLKIIDKLINIQPSSQYNYQFKNHLSQRIIDQFDLREHFNDLLKPKSNHQIKQALNSFQFVKILCKLAPQCIQLQRQIKNIYTKRELLQKLNTCQNYEKKKLYFKILMELYIRNKQLQNFQIQDYFKHLVIIQVQKIPNIWIKLIQRKKLSNQIQTKIHNILEQLLPYSSNKIQTKDEQSYFNYIFDQHDTNQVSILSFCKIIISKWKGKEKSQKLQICRNYMKKLQKFLLLIFYEQNSAYQRGFFQQIENINLALDRILMQNVQQLKQQNFLDQSTKEEVINLYHKLSKIIIQQKISSNCLLTCFGIQQQKLQMKRSNLNINQYVTEEQFMKGMNNLKQKLKRQQEFNQILGGSQLFRFIYANKDKKTRQIDIYFFMDKLISLLEYNKNIKIKNQISAKNQQEQQRRNQSQFAQLNIYRQNQQVSQQQFQLQVQFFCIASSKYQDVIAQSMEKKMRQITSELDKKFVFEWINDTSLNIYKLSQFYECRLLYIFVLSILQRSRQNSSNQYHSKILLDYIRCITLRFCDKPGKIILSSFRQLFIKFQNSKQIAEKFYKLTEKLYQKTNSLIFNHKCEQNLQLIKQFQHLFTIVISSSAAPEIFKTKMKRKTEQLIKKLIAKEINLSCLYNYKLMQAFLLMWSENQLQNQRENGKLMEDPQFIKWVQSLLSSKSMKQMSGSNIKHVNKANFALLVVKTIIKFEQNEDGSNKILNNSISKIQKQSVKLFDDVIIPKKVAHIEELYCKNFKQCSQTFCNYQKITENDEKILNLLLSLFIISRLYLAKNQNEMPVPNNNMTIDWQIHNMVGHIKYKMEERDKNYNFKLPSCHLFSNSDTQKIINDEIDRIPHQILYMLLHGLSKVYFKQVNLLSQFYRQFKPIKLFVSHKCSIKFAILLVFIQMVILRLNTDYLNNLNIDGQFKPNPVFSIVSFISFIINTIFFALQIRTFVNKIQDYFPLKYAHINQILNHQAYHNQQSKILITTKKQQNIKNSGNKTKKQINQFYGNEMSSAQNIPANPNCSEPNQSVKKDKLTCNQILKELFISMLPVRLVILLLFLINIVNQHFVIALIIFLIFDLESPRKLINQSNRGLMKMFLYYIPYTIILDLAMIYFVSGQVQKGSTLVQALKMFLISFYELFMQGKFSSNQLTNSAIQFIYLISQFFFGFAVLSSLAYISHQIYWAKKEEQKKFNKCKICLKTKQELEEKSQNFKYHIQNQHKIWDYIFFFIQFDKKGKLEGINPQIEQQIRRGDYKFIKLY